MSGKLAEETWGGAGEEVSFHSESHEQSLKSINLYKIHGGAHGPAWMSWMGEQTNMRSKLEI